tara:strand:- start:25926 stop:26177 length:252 start_codon:yes stop_codon:yes gene_type:complete
MGISGTLLNRSFIRGERHSSLPERLVILAVLFVVFFAYDDINGFVQEIFGINSGILTISTLIITVPLFSDWLFRVISSITGMR